MEGWYGWLNGGGKDGCMIHIKMMHLRVITYFSGNGQCMERCFQYFSFFFVTVDTTACRKISLVYRFLFKISFMIHLQCYFQQIVMSQYLPKKKKKAWVYINCFIVKINQHIFSTSRKLTWFLARKCPLGLNNTKHNGMNKK